MKFVCPFQECSQLSSTTTKLARHVKNYHGLQRKYRCRICSQAFLSGKNFKLQAAVTN